MNLDETKELRQKTRLANSYDRLFNSKDGKIVLADLAKRYYDSALFCGTAEETAYMVGKRDVVKEMMDATTVASNPKLLREFLEEYDNE